MRRYIDAYKFKLDIKDVAEINGGSFTEFEVLGILSGQPTADVRENVRGEWIEDNPRDKSMMWRCSVCGRIAYYPTIGERKSYKKHCGYNFCPNCGAQMRGESK